MTTVPIPHAVRQFASDTYAGICPEALAALHAANDGHAPAYGDDPWTARATDGVGLRAAEDKAHVHDLHATVLHLLGFNHRRLTFRHDGRNERLTDNAGEIITRALA